MITFALLPKSFEAPFDIIQTNCINSVIHLPCEKQVILFGNETGLEEFAQSRAVDWVPDVEKDEFGTPLLSSLIAIANRIARYEVICYINADIVVFPEFVGALRAVKSRMHDFLLVAKRWNVDVSERLCFENGWEDKFRKHVMDHGKLFAPQAIDIFVFTQHSLRDIPRFAIGRSYFDNWIISEFRRNNIEVVNGTEAFMIAHQNHPYTGFGSIQDIRNSIQGRRNFFLAGDHYMMIATMNDASLILTKDHELQRNPQLTVSVVIPHHGNLNPLKACLRSLTYQTYPRTFYEIIVVINDYNVSYGQLLIEFPFIKICQELKPGPAAARNKGAICSTGQVIAFLDSDCQAKTDWIEKGVQAIGAADSDVLMAGGFQRTDSLDQNAASKFHYLVFLQQNDYVQQRRCISGNLLLSRSLFYKIGLFEESFTDASGEDWEWAGRADRLGANFVYGGESPVYHPFVTTRKQLKGRFIRTVRGNAMRAVREKGGALVREEFDGYPSWRKFKWRIRSILQSDQLTIREKFFGLALFIPLWPKLKREWNMTMKQICRQQKKDSR